MEQPQGSTGNGTSRPATFALWFFVHLAIVYAIAIVVAPDAARVLGFFLPIAHERAPVRSDLFFLSHLLAFAVVPAFVLGMLTARVKTKAAQFVWLISAALLLYQVIRFSFPETSVLVRQRFSLLPALQYFFGSSPEYGDNFRTFLATFVDPNAVLPRDAAQLHFTAPFYAGIAYSLAALLCARMDLDRRIVRACKEFAATRLAAQPQDPPESSEEMSLAAGAGTSEAQSNAKHIS